MLAKTSLLAKNAFISRLNMSIIGRQALFMRRGGGEEKMGLKPYFLVLSVLCRIKSCLCSKVSEQPQVNPTIWILSHYCNTFSRFFKSSKEWIGEES